MNRLNLSEVDFIRLARIEAESPTVNAGRKPHPSVFPSKADLDQEAGGDAVLVPLKKQLVEASRH
jgi:hypothetical protein